VLGRTLVTGRRTNVLIGNRSVIYLPNHVTTIARQRGRLFTPRAEDYFFVAFNDFPWHRVADIVIGRVGYDNYLVGLAIQQNVTVVDATSTILAFHQQTVKETWLDIEATTKNLIIAVLENLRTKPGTLRLYST